MDIYAVRGEEGFDVVQCSSISWAEEDPFSRHFSSKRLQLRESLQGYGFTHLCVSPASQHHALFISCGDDEAAGDKNNGKDADATMEYQTL